MVHPYFLPLVAVLAVFEKHGLKIALSLPLLYECQVPVHTTYLTSQFYCKTTSW